MELSRPLLALTSHTITSEQQAGGLTILRRHLTAITHVRAEYLPPFPYLKSRGRRPSVTASRARLVRLLMHQ